MSDTQKLESMILELIQSIRGIQSDITTMKSDITTMKSDITTIQSDMTSMKSEITTIQSDMISMKSEMNSRFDTVDARLSLLDVWDNKAFAAIEDLRTELKSDGAATRGMIYEAYDHITDMRDILEKRTPLTARYMNRYPRTPISR